LWIGDRTDVATREGWLYLAVLLDAPSRRVIGWVMADHLRAELAPRCARDGPPQPPSCARLIHHTDCGCQYTAAVYQGTLAAWDIVASMSRAGDCDDNAMAERCFATRKAEPIDVHTWPTRAVARLAISEWIEVWYNRQRRHSALASQPPAVFEGWWCCKTWSPRGNVSAETGQSRHYAGSKIGQHTDRTRVGLDRPPTVARR
jgi:transposase InsO family protein